MQQTWVAEYEGHARAAVSEHRVAGDELVPTAAAAAGGRGWRRRVRGDAEKRYRDASTKLAQMQAEVAMHNVLVTNPQLAQLLKVCEWWTIGGGRLHHQVLPLHWVVRPAAGPGREDGQAARGRSWEDRRTRMHLHRLQMLPAKVSFAARLELLHVFMDDTLECFPKFALYYQWPHSGLFGDHGFVVHEPQGRELTTAARQEYRRQFGMSVLHRGGVMRRRIRWMRTVLLVMRFKRCLYDLYDEVHHRPQHLHCDHAATAADMADAFGADGFGVAVAGHNAKSVEATEDGCPMKEEGGEEGAAKRPRR